MTRSVTKQLLVIQISDSVEHCSYISFQIRILFFPDRVMKIQKYYLPSFLTCCFALGGKLKSTLLYEHLHVIFPEVKM